MAAEQVVTAGGVLKYNPAFRYRALRELDLGHRKLQAGDAFPVDTFPETTRAFKIEQYCRQRLIEPDLSCVVPGGDRLEQMNTNDLAARLNRMGIQHEGKSRDERIRLIRAAVRKILYG